MNTTMSMRIPQDLASQIANIAMDTGQTKTNIVIQAMKEYVSKEQWQIQEIKDALEEADRKDFASQSEMDAFWARWL